MALVAALFRALFRHDLRPVAGHRRAATATRSGACPSGGTGDLLGIYDDDVVLGLLAVLVIEVVSAARSWPVGLRSGRSISKEQDRPVLVLRGIPVLPHDLRAWPRASFRTIGGFGIDARVDSRRIADVGSPCRSPLPRRALRRRLLLAFLMFLPLPSRRWEEPVLASGRVHPFLDVVDDSN